MPRLYLTDGATRPLVVSVEDAVGRNCPNNRGDVLLVQFMLYVVDQTPATRNDTWIKTRRGELIQIDGVYGKITEAYVELFQRQFPKIAGAIAHDIRIDPLSGAWFGTRTGVFMTMAALNLAYITALGDNSIAEMVKHPMFPREIRPSLQISL